MTFTPAEKSPVRAEDIVVLLSGTVDTKEMELVERKDPSVREKDYIESLSFWRGQGLKIVFCENSGWDLSKIRNEISGDAAVEILQFEGQNFPKNLGKGYGEMGIIKFAFAHSEFIGNARMVIKVTGRYRVRNFRTFLEFILKHSGSYDLVCNLEKNLSWADSRFFMAKREFFSEYFFGYHQQIDDSKKSYFEHALAKAALKGICDGGLTWSPLPAAPFYRGYYATANTMYSGNIIKHILKNKMQQAAFYFFRK